MPTRRRWSSRTLTTPRAQSFRGINAVSPPVLLLLLLLLLIVLRLPPHAYSPVAAVVDWSEATSSRLLPLLLLLFHSLGPSTV